MRKSVKFVLLATWIGAGTLLLSRWWYAYPDYFPPVSDAVWTWLDGKFGVSDINGASDVELMVVASLALAVVVVVTILGAWVVRRAIKPR